MRPLVLLSSPLLTLTLATAASASSSLPLLGTSWTLTSLTDNGQRLTPGSSAPRPTLKLEGSVASGSTSCNTYRASFATREDILRFTALATTRRACPDRLDGLEQRFVNLMRGVTRFQLQGTTLTLFSGQSDALVFSGGGAVSALPAPRPQPVSPIIPGGIMNALDGQWVVSALRVGAQPFRLTSSASLTFTPDSNGLLVSGTTGCNRVVGRATATPSSAAASSLTLSGLATTRMMCPPAQMAQETALLKVLQGTLSVQASGDRLILSNAAGSLTLLRGAAGAVTTPGQPLSLPAGTLTLTQVDGQPAPTTRRPVTLSFEQGRVGGSDGCNAYGGSYRLDGTRLVLTSPMIGTLMACAEGETSSIRAVLEARPTVSVQGDTVTLTTPDTTLTFSRTR